MSSHQLGLLACTECSLKFRTQEELQNHKMNFCVTSEWSNPSALKAKLEGEATSLDYNDKLEQLTFDGLTKYLQEKGRAEGELGISFW